MITEATRRDIIDLFAANQIAWSGRLEEPAFLSRLYDLQKLPSKDSRYETAAGDIWTHRVSFNDWLDDWVFYDDRFDLLWVPDEQFLRFLCETLHPVVRPNPVEARKLADEFNKYLKNDGWEVFPKGDFSGRPVFGARELAHRLEVLEEPTGWPRVDRQMSEVRARLREATTEEQYQAIGLLCREALISVAQVVYIPERHPTLDGVDASPTDAKRMLEAFLSVELGGSPNEEVRSHAKAALKLAVALQHNRTAEFRTAALCAEATVSLINIVGIVSGARVPTLKQDQ
jgi:hypothetical protein